MLWHGKLVPIDRTLKRPRNVKHKVAFLPLFFSSKTASISLFFQNVRCPPQRQARTTQKSAWRSSKRIIRWQGPRAHTEPSTQQSSEREITSIEGAQNGPCLRRASRGVAASLSGCMTNERQARALLLLVLPKSPICCCTEYRMWLLKVLRYLA